MELMRCHWQDGNEPYTAWMYRYMLREFKESLVSSNGMLADTVFVLTRVSLSSCRNTHPSSPVMNL